MTTSGGGVTRPDEDGCENAKTSNVNTDSDFSFFHPPVDLVGMSTRLEAERITLMHY